MPKVAFLDTMIYLHYKPVEEVPWPDLLETDQVHILVPRVTIGELDNHKDTNAQRKLRERARRILQRIEGWEETQPTKLRAGVVIQVHYRLPRLDFAEFDLDPSRNDDVLIATALDYKQQNPSADVVLVTQDTTPRMVARALGLSVAKLADELKLPVEADPVEQENRELRRQLERLQAASPKLFLRFQGEEADNRTVFDLQRLPAKPEEYIREQVEQLREKYPAQWREQTPFGPMLVPPEHEYRRYNAERERYFEQYEEYLLGTWEREKKRRLSFRIALELVNDGTAPAEDVDLYLHFPDGFVLLEESDLEDEEEMYGPPRPPRPPRTSAEMMSEQVKSSLLSTQPYIPDLSYLNSVHSRLGPPPNISSPTIRETESYEVEWTVQRLKHKQAAPLQPLIVTFRHYESASSFGIDYRLHAGNLPDKVEGKLHVVVKK